MKLKLFLDYSPMKARGFLSKVKLTLFLLGFVFSFVIGASYPFPSPEGSLIVVNTISVEEMEDGVCSIFEAVKNANSDSQLFRHQGECISGNGTDEIRFDENLFSSPQTIFLQGNQIEITDDLIINGPGKTLLTIDGKHESRVFWINDNNDQNHISVVLNGMRVIGGKPKDSDNSVGGGIFNTENLKLSNMNLSGNRAGAGGGLFHNNDIRYFAPGTFLEIQDTEVSNNVAMSNLGGGLLVIANGSTINIDNIKILYNKNGDFESPPTNSSALGAGIYLWLNNSQTIIQRSLIHGNSVYEESQAWETAGGGLYADLENNSYLEISDSELSQNKVSGSEQGNWGGGFFLENRITGEGSTIIINRVKVDHNYSDHNGGGGLIFASNGKVSISNSTFSKNQSKENGGGLLIDSSGGSIENSTFSGNTAKDSGGGLYIFGDLKITNCTVTQNIASSDFQTLGNGGGINLADRAELFLENSIIANNFNNGSPDIFIKPSGNANLFASYTLVGDNSGSGLIETTSVSSDFNGNLIGDPDGNGVIDPYLDELKENTYSGEDLFQPYTHALLAGSPAINVIPKDSCKVNFDQRGMSRPQFNACDMGAYEKGLDKIFLPVIFR